MERTEEITNEIKGLIDFVKKSEIKYPDLDTQNASKRLFELIDEKNSLETEQREKQLKEKEEHRLMITELQKSLEDNNDVNSLKADLLASLQKTLILIDTMK